MPVGGIARGEDDDRRKAEVHPHSLGRREHLQPVVLWCPEKVEQPKKAPSEARPTFYDSTSTDSWMGKGYRQALTASECKHLQAGAAQQQQEPLREACERASDCERCETETRSEPMRMKMSRFD